MRVPHQFQGNAQTASVLTILDDANAMALSHTSRSPPLGAELMSRFPARTRGVR
ncbi:hypothetical protein ACFVX3_18685 [Rhodococcus erythropolis]